MQRSTQEEFDAVEKLIKDTESEILELIAQGKKVHFIWDVDHCLVSGRSDDVFALCGQDVASYRKYETRQFLQVLGAGPWGKFAGRCGQLFHSQDIVTARAGFAAFRVMSYCLYHELHMRDMVFVGSQPKNESYRVILNIFQNNADDWFIFMVDDSARHIESFNKVAKEMGLQNSTKAILSPRLRQYSEEELMKHYHEVMDDMKSEPFYATDGTDDGRTFLVTPEPQKSMREMLSEELAEVAGDAFETGKDNDVRSDISTTHYPHGAIAKALKDRQSTHVTEGPPGSFCCPPVNIRKKDEATSKIEPEDIFTKNTIAWIEAYDRGEEVPTGVKSLIEGARKLRKKK